MKKVLSKNPAFMINYFNVHTIKYLFISIFEKIDSDIIKKSIKDNVESNTNEKKYFEDERNKQADDISGKSKYNIYNYKIKIKNMII